MNHYTTPSALAEALASCGCAITPQAIYKWRISGVPAGRAPLIEAASRGALRCEQICPGVDWTRDASGHITGYHTPIAIRAKEVGHA